VASDVVLVLRSEHRRLRQLVDRVGRSSRGLADPHSELRRALSSHVSAARSEIVPAVSGWPGCSTWVSALDEAADQQTEALLPAVEALVQVEEHSLLPWLQQELSVADRRRLGTLYRVRRDTVARPLLARPSLSRTELYERARRAGVVHRSRMTQGELQAAVEAREGLQAPPR
jgi:hypothetical protein